jgi:hypothetical protein
MFTLLTLGKTAYLHLKVIQEMISGTPFLYQAISGTVYYVSQEIIKIDSSWGPKNYIQAFVDGDDQVHWPSAYLENKHIQNIAAMSPRGIHDTKSWRKQYNHGRGVDIYAISLWTFQELYIAG